MKISLLGFDEKTATFEAASSVAEGKPVAITANGWVQAVTSGPFCGICKNVREGFAAVQLSGYVRVNYTGTLNVGYQMLAAAEGGKVTVDTANGREYLVVDLNTTANIAGIILK